MLRGLPVNKSFCLPILLVLAACPQTEPGDGVAVQTCAEDTPGEELIDLGRVTLNVACQGNGPPLVMLHGFPEFWREWEGLMAGLSDSFQIVAPDQRGYNLSDKPPEVSDYHLDELHADIAALLDEWTDEPVVLVAHDWGGPVGWRTAHLYPDKVAGLVQINGPHPDTFARELSESPEQAAASSYMDFFRSPTAESILTADDYAGLVGDLGGLLGETQLARYREAWGQAGALTGMLNWYRANDLSEANEGVEPTTVDVPTLVLWGLADPYILPGNLDGLEDYVTDLDIRTYPEAGHWLVHEEPASVAEEIRRFAEGVFAASAGGT